jgi:lipopolysaccharide export system protein LptA
MNCNKHRIGYLLSSLLLLPHLALALSSDKDQPIQLEADSVEIDEATGVSIYQGNVIVTQGSLKLWAHKMWIYRKNGLTERIVTKGDPTHFRQLMDDSEEETRGRAKKAEFFVQKDEIHLIDEAVLEQRQDIFRSDRIIYLRSKSLVKAGASAQGKQRVHVTIEPEKSNP